MSSCDVKTTMGSDSCPTTLEDQIVMFSIVKNCVVFNVILSSDSKEEKVIYWDNAVDDASTMRYTRNINARAFMEQFAFSLGDDEYGFTAQFQVRKRNGDHLYIFHFTQLGFVSLYKVVYLADAVVDVLVSSGSGGEWVKVLSAVM